MNIQVEVPDQHLAVIWTERGREPDVTAAIIVQRVMSEQAAVFERLWPGEVHKAVEAWRARQLE